MKPHATHLERHFSSLIDLARDVLNPDDFPDRRRISGVLAADKFARTQERLNHHFKKLQDVEREGDRKRVCEVQVMEIQILIRMIETALGMGYSEGKVNWPDAESEKDGNMEGVRRRVYENVEGLVFGRQSFRNFEEKRREGSTWMGWDGWCVYKPTNFRSTSLLHYTHSLLFSKQPRASSMWLLSPLLFRKRSRMATCCFRLFESLNSER
jgi:hypothetical protein